MPYMISRFSSCSCGFVAPDSLKGLSVLDLGCGAGRDVYILSQLVGEGGRVVGVDMTEEMLAPARATEDWHRTKFGYTKKNTEFITGQIEKLDTLGLADGSFDVVREALL
jgi:arsenite methyltransferase